MLVICDGFIMPNLKIEDLIEKKGRILLRIHNFSDLAANVQSMIDNLSCETIPRVPAQIVWKWQAIKNKFVQDPLQKNGFLPKNGSSFPVSLTSSNQVHNIEVRQDKTNTYYQYTLKILRLFAQ